jgi:hypothetical protein
VSTSFGNRYGRFRGSIKGLPADLAQNHDLHLAAMKKPAPVKKAAPAKSAPVKKSAPAAPSVIVRPTVLEVLEVALSRTTEASAMFGERLVALQATPTIRQDDLGAVTTFDRIGKVADGPSKSFKDWAKSLYEQREREAREAGQQDPKVRLDVEIGTRVVTWDDNRKVSPAWKEQAAKHAQILHAVSAALAAGKMDEVATLLAPFSGPFDQKVWEEAIRRSTPKTGSLTPKIVGD